MALFQNPHSLRASLEIAPSLLAADAACLGKEVRALAAAGADRLHIDVMDGHFVSNLTFGPHVVKALRSETDLPFDVHLMVTQPSLFLDPFQEAGANSLTVHAEIGEGVRELLALIRQRGLAAGIALNPETSPDMLSSLLDDIDLVLVMMVKPGWGGQAPLAGQEEKIQRVRELVSGRGIRVQVDGGVTPSNARILREKGADVLVAGTAILGASCYTKAIQDLRFVDENPEID